jgi:hypothetical protein
MRRMQPVEQGTFSLPPPNELASAAGPSIAVARVAHSSSRLRLAVLCDYPEKDWPSMDLCCQHGPMEGELQA